MRVTMCGLSEKYLYCQKPNLFVTLCFSLAGLSRSTTVVAAYLMYRHKMSLDEALSRIKNRRPGVK